MTEDERLNLIAELQDWIKDLNCVSQLRILQEFNLPTTTLSPEKWQRVMDLLDQAMLTKWGHR